jgi:hypothetical protein
MCRAYRPVGTGKPVVANARIFLDSLMDGHIGATGRPAVTAAGQPMGVMTMTACVPARLWTPKGQGA